MHIPFKTIPAILAAAALIAFAASANAQVDLTGFNTVTGFAGDSTGAFNFNSSPVGQTTGFQNGNFGGFLNDVHGIRNAAGTSAARSTAGGFGTAVAGVDSFVWGTFLSDGGLNGTFMFSDSDPFGLRMAAPFTNVTPNSLTSEFNGGYFLFTDSGQGANANNGLFVAPSAANSAGATNAAFVGINVLPPTQALDVGGNVNIPATAAAGASGVILQNGNRFLHSFNSATNLFAGTNAGNFTTTGTLNTGLGQIALLLNTSGLENTAVGAESLRSNTTGQENVAVGAEALEFNAAGSFNTGVGTDALQDNTANNNTATGSGAMQFNTSGSENTAAGRRSLQTNTTGSQNTAIGNEALRDSTTVNNNTAVGHAAMRFNTTGAQNVAVGSTALEANSTGTDNTAVGFRTLFSSSGSDNTAVGGDALFANNTGNRNTAIGQLALTNSSGTSDNTAVGRNAMGSNSSGASNTALGSNAGSALTTGNNNICIGAGVNGVAAQSNTTRIGQGQTAAFISGIRGITTGAADALPVVIDSNGQLGTVISSRRYKEDIADMADASERLRKLRPVTFRYKDAYNDGGKPIQFGLIAEEVAETFPELAVLDDEGKPETVKYHLLAPLLLNEVQKKDAEIAQMKEDHAALEARLAKLEKLLERAAE